jgi:CRISPR-associated endonuclease/helicase Cas3
LLVSYFGCYIILLTATRPLILRKEAKAVELLDDNERYFQSLNRTVLISETEKKSIEELINWFKDVYAPNKSYLIVCNTIHSSIEVYNKIRDLNLTNYLFYLSTNIIPKQRIGRIEAIKNLLDIGDKPIVVSTQVVEAGVDLDFDTVIRDIGPIDSIIQVAGRCNRESSQEKGNMYVLSLDHLASSVYGKIHPDVAKRLLGNREIEEREFYGLINTYFEEVKPKINDDASEYIWDAMKELRFSGERSVSDFQLIKEKGEYTDIFVEIDNNAKDVWEKYTKDVYEEKNFLKRHYAYLSIRRKFRSYIMSIRKKEGINLPPIISGMGYVTKNQLTEFYSLETGYQLKTSIW